MTLNRILIVVLLVLLGVLSHRLWLADDGYQEVWRLEQHIEERKAEIEAKELRNRQLEAEVKDLKDGVDAVEERARSELGMTREGETFVQIIEEKKPEKEK